MSDDEIKAASVKLRKAASAWDYARRGEEGADPEALAKLEQAALDYARARVRLLGLALDAWNATGFTPEEWRAYCDAAHAEMERGK